MTQAASTTHAVTDAELLDLAASFVLIPFNAKNKVSGIRELVVDRCVYDTELWVIRSEEQWLTMDGKWVWFVESHDPTDNSWPSAREAVEFARAHLARGSWSFEDETRDR